MPKRTCGILCSDTSIFEVLLCHINNFSSYTLINVWWREFDFSNYLFKFLSVDPQYIRSTMTMRLCIFAKTFVFFCIIFIFFCEIFVLFFVKFSHFLAKFLHYFRLFFCEIFLFYFRENFAFFRETDGSEISRKFSRFSRTNEMQKQSEMVAKFFFCRKIFLVGSFNKNYDMYM